MFPYALSPSHKGAKRNTIGVVGGASAILPHYTGSSLAYPIEIKMPLVHHVVECWGCGYTTEDAKA